METLKSEWDQPETTPVRRGQIVRQYGLLYRKYRPKITDEMLLAAWEDQRLMAMRKKVYGATK